MRPGGRRSAAILLALAGAALLLLNFPLLMIWDGGGTLFGLPRLPVMLFLIWVGLILALAWVGEAPSRAPGHRALHDRPDGGDEDTDAEGGS